jgi:putative hydrolase of the HAD superfamily
MIEAVLFDLGDTIIHFGKMDTEALFANGAEETYRYLKSLGKKLPDYETYRKANKRSIRRAYLWSKVKRREFNSMDVVQRVLKRLRVSVSDKEMAELAWLWYSPCVRSGKVEPGTHEMLAALRDAGVKLAIVSNTFIPGYVLDRHLQHEGLLDFFPVRIYSSNVRYQKPHKKIFRIAMQQIGVEPSRAIFIGDLLKKDIKGARRCGMRTVWKPAHHESHPAETKHKADIRIRQITQLPEILRGMGWRAKTFNGRAIAGAAKEVGLRK